MVDASAAGAQGALPSVVRGRRAGSRAVGGDGGGWCPGEQIPPNPSAHSVLLGHRGARAPGWGGRAVQTDQVRPKSKGRETVVVKQERISFQRGPHLEDSRPGSQRLSASTETTSRFMEGKCGTTRSGYRQVGRMGQVDPHLRVNHGWGLPGSGQFLSLEQAVSVLSRGCFTRRVFCLS